TDAGTAYEREAAALENKLDVIQDGMNALGDRPVSKETAQKLQLQLAVLQARHDLALGKVLAHVNKAPASAAYSAYERDAARLENKLDVIRDGMNALGDRPVSQATAQKLQMQLAYLKARHDLALGEYLAKQ
ncbi:hypothetical protein ACUNHH_25295, partial [Serratia sp. IR-2025]